MSFLNLFRGVDINQEVEVYRADKGAVLLDVHCLSGSRSRQAVMQLKQMGYTKVKNIGGISAWKGKVER